MFGRNSNQSNNGVSVNTTFKTLYSDISSLNFGGWNGTISVRIAMSTGSDANGVRQYDQNRRGITSLYPEKAICLYKGYMKNVKPHVDAGETGMFSTAISLGYGDKKNVLALEYKQDTDGKMKHFLTLYQMIDANNAANPQNTFSYKFNQNSYVTDYEPNTGKFNSEEFCESELELFLDVLRDAKDILPITAHGVRYSEAVGARFTAPQNNGNNHYGNQNGPATGGYDPAVTSFVGSEDLGLPFN